MCCVAADSIQSPFTRQYQRPVAASLASDNESLVTPSSSKVPLTDRRQTSVVTSAKRASQSSRRTTDGNDNRSSSSLSESSDSSILLTRTGINEQLSSGCTSPCGDIGRGYLSEVGSSHSVQRQMNHSESAQVYSPRHEEGNVSEMRRLTGSASSAHSVGSEKNAFNSLKAASPTSSEDDKELCKPRPSIGRGIRLLEIMEKKNSSNASSPSNDAPRSSPVQRPQLSSVPGSLSSRTLHSVASGVSPVPPTDSPKSGANPVLVTARLPKSALSSKLVTSSADNLRSSGGQVPSAKVSSDVRLPAAAVEAVDSCASAR